MIIFSAVKLKELFEKIAIQTVQAHVATWRWQIWPKACFRQYSCDIVDENVGDYS